MNEDTKPDVVKWYTRARKFPQLIGRTPDGMKIPGGPYTATQAVGLGVALVVGLNTTGLWARFGFIGNAVVFSSVVWSTVWLLGRVPLGSRNPLSVLTGVARAIGSPTTGRMAGKPVRIQRPRILRHTVVIALPSGATPTTPAPNGADGMSLASPPPPAVAPESPAAHVLTGIQALLASQNSPKEARR